MIPALLSIIIAFGIMGTAIVEVAATNLNLSGNIVKSQKSFNIAEAGLNYYMWHLNHAPTDFKDGKTTPATQDPNLGWGPYVHSYRNTGGDAEGTYTLWIKPAGVGSTVATIRSIGQAAGGDTTRTVQAQIGTPSFASYALVADQALWFGPDESADGPVHSNQGIEMDGASNSTLSSPNDSYTLPKGLHSSVHGDGYDQDPSVWCDPNVTAPVKCSARNKSTWVSGGIPQVNFAQVQSSLCSMKKTAFKDYPLTQAYATSTSPTPCDNTPDATKRTNAYIPQTDPSGAYNPVKGYFIKLNANGKYDLWKVTGEDDTKTGNGVNGPNALTLSTPALGTNLDAPPSGVIFVEDNVWVMSNPKYDGRITIASGKLKTGTAANSYTNINIAGPIVYNDRSKNAIGLVAQDSVLLEPYAPPATGAFNFEVDAAVLAETGAVQYPSNYNTGGASTRFWSAANQNFLFYGSIATRQGWTWTWCSGNPCTAYAGVAHNTTQYDYNLLYAPPPSYPLTSGFKILSWREVITHP